MRAVQHYCNRCNTTITHNRTAIPPNFGEVVEIMWDTVDEVYREHEAFKPVKDEGLYLLHSTLSGL